MGDSYIHWAEVRAIERNIGATLGAPNVQGIKWEGRRGMKWEGLLSAIQYLQLQGAPPKVMVIHVGSNNLGCTPLGHIREDMKRDFAHLFSIYSNTRILASEMLPRLVWDRTSLPIAAIENKRKNLNDTVRRFVTYNGGTFIKYQEITTDTPGLFYKDGAHLSDIGIDMMLFEIKEALST